MSETNASTSRDLGNGVGQQGSSSDCPSQGNAVFKWTNGHFVLESANCKPGHTPPTPPVPDSSEQAQIETFNEFRAIVCCEAGSSS